MARGLVLGGAAGVWEEASDALEMFTPDVVLATNDMIAQWPHRVDIACTLHPEKLADWLKARRKNGYNDVSDNTWSHRNESRGGPKFPAVKHVSADWSGSSGLFATKVGMLEFECSHIILAGVPLVPKASHFVRERPWGSASAFHGGWRRHEKELKPRVRSMSGWTADLLGRPTVEWLNQTPEELTPGMHALAQVTADRGKRS